MSTVPSQISDLPQAERVSWWRCQSRFLRFVVVFMFSALLFLLLVGAWNNWHDSHRPDALIQQMQNDVYRRFQSIGSAKEDARAERTYVVELDKSLERWNKVFQRDDLSKEQRKNLEKLDTLRESVSGWCTLLDPESIDVYGSIEQRREDFHRSFKSVSEETTGTGRSRKRIWPEPPKSPGWQVVVSGTVRSFLDGAYYGLSWPFTVARRGLDIYYRVRSGAHPTFTESIRCLLFPTWALPPITFPWLLGFGILSMAIGYWLCHIGMNFNYNSVAGLGLLYFLHMLVFGVFLACGIMGWL